MNLSEEMDPACCQCKLIVQSIYEKIGVNLPLIAKESFSTVLGPESCPLKHIKSPKKS